MSQLPTLRLFGIDLISASRAAATRDLLARPQARVAFVNAHCVNVAARDGAYRHALQSADMLLP
ncbi:MAG: UDP-phosphate galactose phosphotransferase, partial [Alphaproteobacteria bacterium]|nr:UDP-phosphate galactose phosphotransferase [Alphaproteobacteria bacterium]